MPHAVHTTWLGSLAQFVSQPLTEVDLTAAAFWAELLNDRLLIVAALPLLPLLLLTPRRHLPAALIAGGLVFVGALFGVFYLLLWILACLGLYAYGEWFAREVRRTDILPIGPPLAAWVILGGLYFGSFFWFQIGVKIGPETNLWLFDRAPWLFPFWPVFLLGGEQAHELARNASGHAGLFQMFTFVGAHLMGTAYLAVRMLQYLADIRRGQIPAEQRSLRRFLMFVCYPATLMQGPIERYQRFHDQIDRCADRRDGRAIRNGLGRIAWGLVKATLSTLYLIPIIAADLGFEGDYYARPHLIESYAFLYFGVYLHIFWLYVEFSAYCDIAVGFSRILGYKLVENFNWPWIATSMRDFWRRWHISLSAILRDYIYIPLGGNRRHQTLNLCITFALVGIWHGPFWQLAVWGVAMGLLVAGNQAWVQWHKRTAEDARGPAPLLRRIGHAGGPLTSLLCWALTMHCFCHSLLIFFGGWGGFVRVTWELIRRPLGIELEPGP